MNLHDTITGAVRRTYEARVCVFCDQSGILGGDYPVPLGRGTFADLGCYADEQHMIDRDCPQQDSHGE